MKLDLPELHHPNDLIALAIESFIRLQEEQLIQVWLNGEKEAPYLASYFVRNYEKMPVIEQKAMSLSKGKILDIGAGAGPHSAHLIGNNFEVHSLELNSMNCNRLRKINKAHVIEQDFFSWSTSEEYDTILLLMNGFGICEIPNKLTKMGEKLKSLLNKDGQILAEITDYDFSDFYDHDIKENPAVTFRLKYGDKFSKEFNWFYPKFSMIQTMCNQLDFKLEKVFQEEEMLLIKLTHLS